MPVLPNVSLRRSFVGLVTVLGLAAGVTAAATGAAPSPANAAAGSVAVMNLTAGKRNSDVLRYQKALRAYAQKVGVSAHKYNPSGATGYYGTQTQALTKAVYQAIARKTGDKGWGSGEIRFPGRDLLVRIGLSVSTTPYGINNVGGASKLITVEGAHMGSTTGNLIMWQLRSGKWIKVATYSARFGANGLVEGTERKENTNTTPSGFYSIPFAFGTAENPDTTLAWRHVTRSAWWCEDSKSSSYNRWVDPLPKGCRASESEHLVAYKTYSYAAVIGFNYVKPVKGRGAGIFLHVNGNGLTAGCVSISSAAMKRVLTWMTPGAKPHIAIGSSASLVDL